MEAEVGKQQRRRKRAIQLESRNEMYKASEEVSNYTPKKQKKSEKTRGNGDV